MRFRRKRRDRAHGKFGRPVIEIEYADGGSSGMLPIAYLVDGATREDAEYVRKWLDAVRSQAGQSADHFIPRDL